MFGKLVGLGWNCWHNDGTGRTTAGQCTKLKGNYVTVFCALKCVGPSHPPALRVFTELGHFRSSAFSPLGPGICAVFDRVHEQRAREESRRLLGG
ncbi:hypothetical protein JTB14_017255 [Gonioctena quinquepunctata]|nr:hypothetical protein JTB14_017255 [Gonioctena quinquepunctata]